jgi:hypothetical protein
MQYFQIWQYCAPCSFRSGMSAGFLGELGSCARKVSSVCNTQKLTTGKLSYAIFPDLVVFCFLFIQKWNECRFLGGLGFVCSKGVLCVWNTKINPGRTELCNISIFGSILLLVHSWVEWARIFLATSRVYDAARGNCTEPLGLHPAPSLRDSMHPVWLDDVKLHCLYPAIVSTSSME